MPTASCDQPQNKAQYIVVFSQLTINLTVTHFLAICPHLCNKFTNDEKYLQKGQKTPCHAPVS